MIVRSAARAVLSAMVVAVFAASPVAAQEIRILDDGPPGFARPLADVLAGPHELRVTTDSLVNMPRGETHDRSIVIIGARRVTVGARVNGSVIVIGGDLFLHPGVDLAGDAVAYGGGVYRTALGRWRRTIDNRDFTFALGGTPGSYTLTYEPLVVDWVDPFELPLLSGFRIPSYDRVNGVSLPWGPRFNLAGGRYVVDAIGTYRSDLGAVDPRLEARARLSRLDALSLVAERATLTNENWIRSSLLNSLSSIAVGTDARNYWRADRAELWYRRTIELATGTLVPAIGGRVEDGSSVGPEPGTTSNPWSVVNASDSAEGMRRPNPPITPGRISSGVAGLAYAATIRDVGITTDLLIEAPFETPDDSRFVQGTLDARVEFPTVPNQRFRLEAHALLTGGDVPPPQRFTYLGGSGTIPTLDLLTQRGDQVLFMESRYTIEFPRLAPNEFLGPPSLALRHIIGSAGVDRLPGFVNNLGVQVAIWLLKFDFTIDPETRDTDVSAGLKFTR